MSYDIHRRDTSAYPDHPGIVFSALAIGLSVILIVLVVAARRLASSTTMRQADISYTLT